MTNKEAINVLKDAKITYIAPHGKELAKEALEMAIKSLEQKPYKDLIAEIDKLPRIKVGNANSPTVKYCINEVLIYDLLEYYKAEKTDTNHYRVVNISYSPYTIDSTSNSYSVTISKTTEQPAAKWEYKKIPNTNIIGWWCSNCHIGEKSRFAYCPNCGSKMEVEGEVEE